LNSVELLGDGRDVFVQLSQQFSRLRGSGGVINHAGIVSSILNGREPRVRSAKLMSR
jgi:hypothetical protein